MVDILPAIGVIAANVFIYDFAAPLRNGSPLTGSTAVFDLPDVTSLTYQTVFAMAMDVEDVGSIDILSLFVDFRWQIKGKGQTRWQVSGDGGNTFVDIHQSAPFDTLGIFVPIERAGTGTWITSINHGQNQFIIRLQALVTSGTVSTKLDDFSFLSLQYRRIIIP